MMEQEERLREVMGMSAMAKCLALAKLHDALKAEGKVGDKDLVTMFQRTPGCNAGWSLETITRYIQVGRKLAANQEVLSILERWETFMGRDAAFDPITALRSLAGLNVSDEDTAYIAWASTCRPCLWAHSGMYVSAACTSPT
jgi:hypothetical protein